MPVDTSCRICGERAVIELVEHDGLTTCRACRDAFVGKIDDVPDLRLPAELRKPHPGFWWAALWSFGLMLMLQLLPAIIGFAIYVAIFPQRRLAAPDAMVASREFGLAMLPGLIISQVFSIAAALVALRLFVGREWMRKVALRWPSWSQAALVLIGLPGMMVLTIGVSGLARRVLPDFQALEGASLMFKQWPWALAIFAVAVGPGIGEELWFRAFLGRGLVGRFGVIGGVLLTSLFFGLVHLDPVHATAAMFIGLFLHLAYLATRSLLIPILIHIANNALSVSSLYWEPAQFADAAPDDIPWFLYAAAAVLVVAVSVALYRSRARLVDDGTDSPWRSAFPGVEAPPPSGTRVVHPSPGVVGWGAALVGIAIFLAVAVPCVRAYNAQHAQPAA